MDDGGRRAEQGGLASPLHLTKRELAEIAIRNAIETGHYQPGQVISQRRISEDLALGVTPIREAVLVLSNNGIVERHSHHSIRVAPIDPSRLEAIFAVRKLLESEAVTLAAAAIDRASLRELARINNELGRLVEGGEPARVNDLDRAFHQLVFAASGNDALVWTIDRVKSSFPLYALWREPDRLRVSVREHDALIAALRAGDSTACARLQQAHLEGGLKATIAYVRRAFGVGDAALEA